MHHLVFIIALLSLQAVEISGFVPLTQEIRTIPSIQKHNAFMKDVYESRLQSQRKISTKLFFFRKIFRQNKDDQDINDDEQEVLLNTNQDDETTESNNFKNKASMPFFAKVVGRNVEKQLPETKNESNPLPEEKKQLSPVEQAKALRDQAEKARLEAEKLDIILTLEKIEKLEKQLASKIVKEDPSKAEDVKKQIQILKAKLDGDKKTNDYVKHIEDTKNEIFINENSTAVDVAPVPNKKDLDAVLESVVAQSKAKVANDALSLSDIESRVQHFNDAPQFMKELVVKANGMDIKNLNITELVIKMYEDEKSFNVQNSASDYVKVPEFTQEQIDEVLEAVNMVPQFIKNMYGDELKNNDTAIAIMMLEEEWREGRLVEMPEITQKMIDDKLDEFQWIPQFLRGDNDTALAIELIKSDYRRNGRKYKQGSIDDVSKDLDVSSNSRKGGLFGFGQDSREKTDKENMVEALFPQSTRKEGEELSKEVIQSCISDILSKDNIWMVTGPPEKVPGGFIIRGKPKFESGKELIEEIDKKMEKSRLKEQFSVFYVFDPTPVTKEQIEGGEERSPVLFVTSSNVARDPAPIQRSLISAVAFGTIWYNALLPFLLNDKIMKLADEQLALADASMSANLDFLNEMSFPLFVATIVIQLSHELAHFIVAQANGLKISLPTFVPSLATGLTGAITSLKQPPKDKQELFDFAISGPLVGMAVSVLFVYVGMMATVTMDASAYSDLPALPLTLLRQSSLVGGIIDSMSPGLLSVPDAALGSRALNDINIPLHPLVIAGYFGMMINAANLLPTGRTDGGRIATSLFGRSGTQLVSLITFIGMFLLGLSGSDLILFYFSYVVFFQSELEIPQRNEVDDIDFSRVLIATTTGVLVLLTLIPM
jgi:membrane-associated protease RseP (regulator of RpoE activity)/protein-arginine kinase activator protein McsA